MVLFRKAVQEGWMNRKCMESKSIKPYMIHTQPKKKPHLFVIKGLNARRSNQQTKHHRNQSEQSQHNNDVDVENALHIIPDQVSCLKAFINKKKNEEKKTNS